MAGLPLTISTAGVQPNSPPLSTSVSSNNPRCFSTRRYGLLLTQVQPHHTTDRRSTHQIGPSRLSARLSSTPSIGPSSPRRSPSTRLPKLDFFAPLVFDKRNSMGM